jgi:CheY-like chemotaxis protein
MTVSILVVADQPEMLLAIRETLATRGYVVHATASSEVAVRVLTESEPCMLLWDPLSRGTASLLPVAHRHRVAIAVIPVSADCGADAGTSMRRLLCHDALMSVVEQHCPLPRAA